MSAHTPGPLGIHSDGALSGDGMGIIALAHPKQVTIAWTAAVRTGLSEDQRVEAAEAQANARELVHRWNAHDDLLAALKRSEALLEHLMKNVPWGVTCNVDFGELNAVLCALPGVIARAEGKS